MKKEIRILHVITTLSFGGAEAMLYKLLYHTRKETTFKHHVVCLSEKDHYGGLIEALKIPVYALDLKHFPDNIKKTVGLPGVLNTWRPTIMVSWLYHADLFSTLIQRLIVKRPLAWNIRCSNMNLYDYSVFTRLVFNSLIRFSHLPDTIIANSVSGKNYHQQAGYHAKKWIVIPNGFDTRLFSPDLDQRKRYRLMHDLPSDCPIIGMVARFDPMKNHALFFKVAKQLSDQMQNVRFVLIGKGMDKKNPVLGKMISDFDLVDKVLPMGIRVDLNHIYPAFDLLVSTSSTGEGFPNVIGEAMACGVPVVGTDVGDTAHVIGDGGIVVPPNNPALMTEACISLLSLSQSQKASLGEVARNRIIKHFSIDHVCRRYINLFSDLNSEN